MLNIKARPSKIFVPQGDGAEAEGGGEEEGGEGGFDWHCKSGLAANIQRVKDEFCKERGLKPFKIAVSGKPCSGKSFFSQQLAQHYGVPHIHKEQVLHDIEHWNEENERLYNFKKSEKERLAKLAEERQKEKEEAEALKKAAAEAAEQERLRKIQEEMGSQTGEEPPESPKEE